MASSVPARGILDCEAFQAQDFGVVGQFIGGSRQDRVRVAGRGGERYVAQSRQYGIFKTM